MAARGAHPVPGIRLGIGDDCALIDPDPKHHLAVSTDSLLPGVHFLETTGAEDIGWRALAVNLSDLAAMGATPRWFTLALTLPTPDPHWLTAFGAGLAACAGEADLHLVGGNLARGALNITIQVAGSVPFGAPLLRSGAASGDRLCVTGSLGEAAAGLALCRGDLDLPDPLAARLRRRYSRPVPQLPAGQALRRLASAAIDLSDGLCGDLGHLEAASGVGFDVAVEALPIADDLVRAVGREQARSWALHQSDDYELLCTVPEEHWQQARARCAEVGVRLTPIGTAVAGASRWRGLKAPAASSGYRHF